MASAVVGHWWPLQDGLVILTMTVAHWKAPSCLRTVKPLVSKSEMEWFVICPTSVYSQKKRILEFSSLQFEVVPVTVTDSDTCRGSAGKLRRASEDLNKTIILALQVFATCAKI